MQENGCSARELSGVHHNYVSFFLFHSVKPLEVARLQTATVLMSACSVERDVTLTAAFVLLQLSGQHLLLVLELEVA